LAIYALQLAFILLIVVGLIFRTKETIGFLLLCGVVTGFTVHPFIGLGLLVLVLVIFQIMKAKERAAAAIDDNDPTELPPPTTD
jgi:hypothetical protein